MVFHDWCFCVFFFFNDTATTEIYTLSLHDALPISVRHLYQAGVANQFDMKLVQATVGYLGIYPVGSLLELTTGEHAVVIELNPAETLHPYVKLIKDHEGQPYATPPVVNLGVNENGEKERAIRRILDPVKEGVGVGCYLEEPSDA